jgi:hypothetical protein
MAENYTLDLKVSEIVAQNTSICARWDTKYCPYGHEEFVDCFSLKDYADDCKYFTHWQREQDRKKLQAIHNEIGSIIDNLDQCCKKDGLPDKSHEELQKIILNGYERLKELRRTIGADL